MDSGAPRCCTIKQDARTGSPFCPLLPVVLMLPRESRQDQGREAQHHPTKRGTQQDQPPRCSQCSHSAGVLPMPFAPQERKPTTPQAHKERGTQRKKGSDKPTSPQKRGTPPLRQVKRRCYPHHKFAPKNQQKVAWGSFEKIFGKIFRGDISGVRKTPRVVSTEGGCLTNENREISNLAMQKNQKRTKALLNNRGQR